MPSNLAELVAKSAAGDAVAFGQLVVGHAGIVSGIALSVCGNFAASEDIAQEAFVEAWKNIATLRDPEKFASWVCTIARRRAIDHVRQSKATQSLDQSPLEVRDPSSTNPESNMSAQQHRELVWSMLESLPETYRETMVLFYRGEQSTRDVAIALDESEATIRQRLKRGRELVRSEVTDAIRVALMETAPKAAFAAAVVAALPSTTFAASASTASGVVATSKTSTVAAAGSAALSGAAVGTMVGFLGGAIGAWNTWRNCEFESQQRFVVRLSVIYVVGFAISVILLAGLISARVNGWLPDDRAYGLLLVGLIIGFQMGSVVWMWRVILGFKRVGREAANNGEPIRPEFKEQQTTRGQKNQRIQEDANVTYAGFRWNGPAWAGSILGASAWMLVVGVIAVMQGSSIVSVTALSGFAIVVTIAIVMWNQRDHRDAFAAILTLITVLGVITGIVFAAIQLTADRDLKSILHWSGWVWLALILFPAAVLQLTLIRKQFSQEMNG